MDQEEVASRRLREALDEQARLSVRYEESIGTSGEIGAYVRLQAATLAVANCDRIARRRGGDSQGPTTASFAGGL